MAKHSPQILQLAKRGAEVRLRELVTEAALLFVAFPDLRQSFDRDGLPVEFILARGAKRAAKRQTGRRKRMSATARAAVSARMKKYWAERRKAKKK